MMDFLEMVLSVKVEHSLRNVIGVNVNVSTFQILMSVLWIMVAVKMVARM